MSLLGNIVLIHRFIPVRRSNSCARRVTSIPRSMKITSNRQIAKLRSLHYYYLLITIHLYWLNENGIMHTLALNYSP